MNEVQKITVAASVVAVLQATAAILQITTTLALLEGGAE